MGFNSKLSAILAGVSLFATVPAASGDSTAAPAPKKPAVTAVANPYAAKEQALITAYKPFVAELEGLRYNIYDDHGAPAVGWGYNFDINDGTKYSLIEVSPKAKGGVIQLKPADMAILASDKLTLAAKRTKFPQYNLTQTSKTVKELKAARKPAGMDSAFEGSVFVMLASKVDSLNNTRLSQFVQEAAAIAGSKKFYGWTMGQRMAYLDMYYVLRKKIKDSKFHKYMMNGEFDKASQEAWASRAEKSEPNKKKRRHETRETWYLATNILPKDVAKIYITYVKNLPGEKRLHDAMKAFLDAEAERNQQGLNNAIAKQNSSYGG